MALECSSVQAGGGDTPLTTVRIATGLRRPVGVAAPVGDTERFFVIEKQGIIRVIENGVLLPDDFLNIDAIVNGGNSNNDERGLLGLAFHPNYSENGYFYINFINSQNDTTIARYTVESDDPNTADAGSRLILMTIDQPEGNHNGGWMDFGPNDGYLYIAMGDGGGANDSHPFPGNGQNLNNCLGAMLRIDVDDCPADLNNDGTVDATDLAILLGAWGPNPGHPADLNNSGEIEAADLAELLGAWGDCPPYGIPEGNPFADGPGGACDEIWAYGLRNPWRNSFDPENGDLYIADVGQGSWEEVNRQPGSGIIGGENYGWRCMEGNACTGLSGCTCNSPTLTDPIHVYSHGGSPFRCSITGGEMYRGSAIPDLQGTYFFADYCSEQIWSFRVTVLGGITDFQDRTSELDPPGASIDFISSFGRDGMGEVYICDQGSSSANGEIFKIIADEP
jgi:glucose/arabinose dehydrogenase